MLGVWLCIFLGMIFALSPFSLACCWLLPLFAVCLRKPVCHLRPPKFWGILVLIFGCRLGEASNPGPQADQSFVLGAFNPSGLPGKAPYVAAHLEHGDIWAVSETHLCMKGTHDFRAGLHFAQSSYRYVVTGHPVPASTSRTHPGQWKGVAMLSKFPTRTLPLHGHDEVYESSRALVTATLMDDIWITGGVVYGEPDGHLYPQHNQHNELLLQAVVSQVCGLAVGPRFVAGDWNSSPNSLPVFALLQSFGFRDIQDVAWERWGIQPKETCKRKTRKDYCFLSPELQVLMKGCHILDDVWPDHAVLQGEFARLSNVVPRQIWPLPADFPWPLQWNVDPQVWANSSAKVDDRYIEVWKHIESAATEALPFGVPKACLGRAGATNTKGVVAGKIAPVKKGRKGDFNPQFLCASFRHAQWIRQVRRLQSFAHFAKGSSFQPSHPHALAVWGSIIRAKGFAPSFCDWWDDSKFRVHGAPVRIPVYPPEASIAVKFFESVALAARDFEGKMKKSSRAYARLRRESNPNMIFQDIRAHPVKGVDLLLRPIEAVVQDVRADEAALVLDRSFDFQPGCPVVCNDKCVEVIHAEDDCLWVDGSETFQPGDRITQLARLGTDEELCQAFIHAWSAKWTRHAEVPISRWKPILDFARAKLPFIPMQWPQMTPANLREVILQKKSATSHGLDGVSLADLKALPMPALQNFCAMFAWAERTGEWPMQVTAGRVTSLAKCEHPRHPMDFRPITVFSLLYRCWGSFHSKKILLALDPHLPVGLFGSRPQCFAGQVWSQVLWTIENAQFHSIGLCGILADLQKAFNMLPRVVAIEACAILGVPLQVLIGWAGALSQMQRRFQIRQTLSPAVLSNCGFPEGDALSCVAMLAIDFVFHEWFQHFMPLAQPITYVDDWQLLVCDPASVGHAIQTLDTLVDALDLMLDKKKTHVWAVQSESRTILRAQGFTLSSSCKNLGAHLQVTKKHSNSVQIERINSLQPLWQRLRLSTCRYRFKVRALKCAAWPKGLHAIAATTISLQTFQSLRAGAMKGLGEDHAGSNSHLHLGLIETPQADPHYWCIQQTLRFVKDCGRVDVVQEVLATMAHGVIPAQNSITSTLLHRIQFLGWHVNHDGHIVDAFGSFSLFAISCTELFWRLEWQWLKIVVSATAHRDAIGGLEFVWPQSTRAWLQAQNPSDQALYRKLLNGTHITQDGKKYSQESNDDMCPFCHCSDSRYHRFWQCEHFAWAREHVSGETLSEIRDLPEAASCFGWDIMPSTMYEWCAYFSNLPRPVTPCKFAVGTCINLFTDGSCFYQSQPHFRFAAWAVVLAAPEDACLLDSHIIESGPLPGLLQSASRAELFAVMRAIEFALVCQVDVTIWTDCNAVFRRLRRVLHGSRVKSSSAHADLWDRISAMVQDCSHSIQVQKVAAHQHVSAARDQKEAWMFCHNKIADREAVAANLRRPREFWDLVSRHWGAVAHVEWVNQITRGVLLNISRAVVQAQHHDDGFCDEPPVQDVSLPVPVWKGLSTLSLPAQAIKWYGEDTVRLVLSWFWDVLYTSCEAVKWVSHIQLYADFMAATGNPGPVNLQGWKNGAIVPYVTLKGFSYKLRVRWFIKILKECLRHMGQEIQFAVGLPHSNMVRMHTGLFAVPWPEHRLIAVDKWLYSCIPFAFRRQSKAVDSLPYIFSLDVLERTLITSLR